MIRVAHPHARRICAPGTCRTRACASLSRRGSERERGERFPGVRSGGGHRPLSPATCPPQAVSKFLTGEDDQIPESHRLSYRGNDRDAVPARRRRPRRRHLRLHGPAAGGARKPKVSAFINARFEKIEALKPDLVLAFSDLQADIAAELIRRGYPVVTFNQRSIAEILQMIRMVGALVGRQIAAESLAIAGARAGRIRERAADAAATAARVLRRMGRPAHLRHPLGGRAHRNRRRPAAVSRTPDAAACAKIGS